mmetsp:Transcript_19220/g.30961  ORF Transcript_19220/g.30961 Transcript_19220/m.30961 type:complete len:83 (+) Transcript_19220:760-1008(+)
MATTRRFSSSRPVTTVMYPYLVDLNAVEEDRKRISFFSIDWTEFHSAPSKSANCDFSTDAKGIVGNKVVEVVEDAGGDDDNA